jgi:hypothetical protein
MMSWVGLTHQFDITKIAPSTPQKQKRAKVISNISGIRDTRGRSNKGKDFSVLCRRREYFLSMKSKVS